MADEDLLQSWKEIAAYLERSERTCRRWETEYRLPVHRMDGSVRGSVFAYKSELDRWMDDTLHEERHGSPPQKRLASRRSLIIILSLAFLTAVAVAVMVFRGGRSEPQRTSLSTKPTLAILPFTNNTGDESLDFWEVALADLLVSDLSQSRYLNVRSQDRLFLVLQELGQLEGENRNTIDLTEIAARARVENIVVGNFVRVGQRFRIGATVRNIPAGNSVVVRSVEARSEDEILLRIDQLSAEIKNQVVRPVGRRGGDPDLNIGSITTSSLEAYRHFVEGRLSLYDGSAIGAMESFEKAVAIDPEFAMAYSSLSKLCRDLPGYEDKAEESRSRAFELSDHLSLRERLYLRGDYYLYRGQRSWDRALESFLELVRVYPDDGLAVIRLRHVYFLLEEWEKCIEISESITDDQKISRLSDFVRRSYCALGQYEAALECAEGFPSNTDSIQYRDQLMVNLVFDQRFEAALLEADSLLERSPGYVYALMIKGDVHLFRAEWDQAEVYYRELLNPVAREQNRLRFRLIGWRRLANLYLAKGQFQTALDIVDQTIDEVTAIGEQQWLLVLHVDKAATLLAQGNLPRARAEIEMALEEAERRNHVTGKVIALGIQGMIFLEMGSVGEAERSADKMKAEIEGWLNPKIMRNWHNLAGHIDLARNDVGRAVQHFERAVLLLPSQFERNGDEQAPYFSSLAHAYYLSGDMGMAQEWYEKTVALTFGRLGFGEAYAESLFMLGRIFEQQGMNAEAIQSYRTFRDLRREADFMKPEVKEAKRSLATLLD